MLSKVMLNIIVTLFQIEVVHRLLGSKGSYKLKVVYERKFYFLAKTS